MDNIRIKELKYNKNIYTDIYKINELLIKFNLQWFIDVEVENMRLEIFEDTLIINSGTWYNGVFKYGVIRDVEFKNGIIENGVIYNGVFKNVTIEKGIIFDGVFLNGNINFADIRGGTFKNINISDKCYIKDETNITKNEKMNYINNFKLFLKENYKNDNKI